MRQTVGIVLTAIGGLLVFGGITGANVLEETRRLLSGDRGAFVDPVPDRIIIPDRTPFEGGVPPMTTDQFVPLTPDELDKVRGFIE